MELILITHRHADHTAGARRFAALTGAPVRAADPDLVPRRRNRSPTASCCTAGGCTSGCWRRPGHTSDSVSLPPARRRRSRFRADRRHHPRPRHHGDRPPGRRTGRLSRLRCDGWPTLGAGAGAACPRARATRPGGRLCRRTRPSPAAAGRGAGGAELVLGRRRRSGRSRTWSTPTSIRRCGCGASCRWRPSWTTCARTGMNRPTAGPGPCRGVAPPRRRPGAARSGGGAWPRWRARTAATG